MSESDRLTGGATRYMAKILHAVGATDPAVPLTDEDLPQIHMACVSVAAIMMARGCGLPHSAELVAELTRIGSDAMQERTDRVMATLRN